MSGSGPAVDQAKDEARAMSRGCPHCGGEGLCEVFMPDFDGRRVVRRECIVRGEVKLTVYPQVIAAICICPMGEWVRSKHDRETLDRVPCVADVMAGRSRYRIADPTGLDPGPWFQRQQAGGGVVPVGKGR